LTLQVAESENSIYWSVSGSAFGSRPKLPVNMAAVFLIGLALELPNSMRFQRLLRVFRAFVRK